MPAGFDRFFGFDTTQKATLEKLLGSQGLTPEQEELLTDLAESWDDLAAAAALLDGIPTTDPEVDGEVWNDGGTLKVSAGA